MFPKKTLTEADVATYDWTGYDATTDADIARQIAQDPDTAPDLTDEQIARGQLVFPAEKTLLSLRIDNDVLDGFRRAGPGYQQRINQALRRFAVAQGWIPRERAHATRTRGRPRKAS